MPPSAFWHYVSSLYYDKEHGVDTLKYKETLSTVKTPQFSGIKSKQDAATCEESLFNLCLEKAETENASFEEVKSKKIEQIIKELENNIN